MISRKVCKNILFMQITCIVYDKWVIKKSQIRTTRKSQCISIYGVRLSNEFNAELKNAKDINIFKIAFKRQVYFKYNSHN